MAMDQIVNQRPNPPEYKCSDTAPPMTLNQNQNSMTFQNENKGPSPLELDCSLNAPSNVHSPMKDIQNTESIQQHSVYPLPQNNIDALPLVFRQFTESDYDYSDSEENAAMDFQRNEPMERNEQNVDNTELRLLMAKYEKFGIVIERGHSLGLFDDPDGDDWRNRLCPYCLMVCWTKKHRAECLFIPKCIQ